MKRVLLDANVLLPSVMREMLIGTAAAGGFVPLWSARILEEWARAARRLPPGAEAMARARIAQLRVEAPAAETPEDPALEARLSLPDPQDRHVLAAAINGRADVVMTLNRRDFPTRTLARHGLTLREPDGFLCALAADGVALGGVARAVRARAEAASGRPQALRALLKRAGLPRLGKLLAAAGDERAA